MTPPPPAATPRLSPQNRCVCSHGDAQPRSWLPPAELRAPLLAVTVSSGVCVAISTATILWLHHMRSGVLLWNLFLAWLPLVFALIAYWLGRSGARRDWRFGVAAAAWLLFFPNAPYICTDLVHLPPPWWPHYWPALVLILLHAVTGLVVGCLSLFLLHTLVARRWGRIVGWAFAGAVCGLSGFGIYLGRVERFNSWDAVTQPKRLFEGISQFATQPPAEPTLLAFSPLFGLFVFLSYLMLYSLTRLSFCAADQTARPAAEP